MDRYRYEAGGERALMISLLLWVLFRQGDEGIFAAGACLWLLISAAYGILYFMAPKP